MVSCRLALAVAMVLGAVGMAGGEGHGGCETLTCDAGAQEFCAIVEHQPSRANHAAIPAPRLQNRNRTIMRPLLPPPWPY